MDCTCAWSTRTITVSPTTAAPPFVLLTSNVMRSCGVLSLVNSLSATVGELGANLSKTWAWAAVIAPKSDESAIVAMASAIAACCCASTCTPSSTPLSVEESLRFTLVPACAASVN